MKDIENQISFSDDEDEWYCNSIKRYSELFMFDLEHPIQSIDTTDPGGLCILSKKSSHQQVISQHGLPIKIVKRKRPLNFIVKDTDMKVRSGVFPEAEVSQMCSLYNQDKLITSEENVSGINIYQLNSSGSDRIVKLKTLNIPFVAPKISMIDNKTAFLAKDSSQPCRIVDLFTGETKSYINHSIESATQSLLPVILSQSTVALAEDNGEIHVYDTRTGTTHGKIEGTNENGKCSVSSGYEYKNQNCSTDVIAILFSTGFYCFYDPKNLSQELIKGHLNISHDRNSRIKLKFSPNGTKVSLSGFGGKVSVFNFKNNMKREFCHDGHEHMEHCKKETVVTDQLWYDEDCIISSADNNSLHCWHYNPEEDK